MARDRVNPDIDALIAVDVQNDFCPGVALEVENGDEVVPVLNRWLAMPRLFKAATRDWHPAGHCSFKDQGGDCPPHCVQDTEGAEFHPELAADAADLVVDKAIDPGREQFSAFESEEFINALQERGILRVYIGGLATEYCVKANVLAAIENGYETFVIEDAIRAVEVNTGDSRKARDEMAAAGATFVTSEEVL